MLWPILRSDLGERVNQTPAWVSLHRQGRREFFFGAIATIAGFFISVGFGARWTALLDYSYLPNLAFAISNGGTLWGDLDHPLPPGATVVSWLFYSAFGWSSVSA